MSQQVVMFRRSPEILWRAAGREVLLARPGREDFDRLSETGGLVWSLLEVPRTLEALVETMAEAYGLRPDAIAADVEGLIGELRRRGCVEETVASHA
jgi:hypothetical protein